MRDVDREAIYIKRLQRVGEWIEAIGLGEVTGGLEGGKLTGISLRLPTEGDPEVLLVLKATGAEGKVVSFIGGLDAAQAILTWRAKARAGKMKWREDKPWGVG